MCGFEALNFAEMWIRSTYSTLANFHFNKANTLFHSVTRCIFQPPLPRTLDFCWFCYPFPGEFTLTSSTFLTFTELVCSSSKFCRFFTLWFVSNAPSEWDNDAQIKLPPTKFCHFHQFWSFRSIEKPFIRWFWSDLNLLFNGIRPHWTHDTHNLS